MQLGAAVIVVLIILVVAAGAWAFHARSAPKAPAGGSSLYDRLGGAFGIAAVVSHFSDALLKSPVVGVDSPNPQLREWSRGQSTFRLPGLKFLRTLWVCDVAGGPQRFAGTKPGRSRLDLSAAHRHLRITPAEFDEVARLLGVSLEYFDVPPAEKATVLAAFAAHKGEVTAGSVSGH
jgi:hemoglobin